MSIDQELDSLLQALEPVYDECRRLRSAWDNLQLLPRAQKEYDLAREKEEQELARLREQEKNLNERKQELEPRPAPPPPSSTPWSRPVTSPNPGIGGAPLGSRDRPPPPPPPPPPGMSLANRRLLLRRVNRYARRWHLSEADVEKINSIADDPDRPLGEALALLDWNLYSGPWLKSETAEAHRDRLQDWGAELKIYRDRLQTEIDIERATHSGVLDIWQRWLEWNEGPEGQKAWEGFIQDSRQALVDQQAETRESIAKLQARIAELQASSGAGV